LILDQIRLIKTESYSVKLTTCWKKKYLSIYSQYQI